MNEHPVATLGALLDAIAMPEEMRAALLSPDLAGEALPGANELRAHLELSLRNRQDGPWAGLPEEIFLATMGAFSRFVREHIESFGCAGFDRGFWTTRQAGALLFRVGTLEYELREEGGERWLSLHIPSDADLGAEALNASVAAARAFFARYRPAWDGVPMRLHTWLLSPALPELLGPSSRIVRFQKAFDIQQVDWDEDGYLEWVYKLRGDRLETTALTDLPEDTTLQRRMKERLLAGGKIGEARGVLAREFV